MQVSHGGVCNKIQWKVDIDKLDYNHYLPLFFTGLREVEDPIAFLATQGAIDMIESSAARRANKVLECIPQLIMPIKTALNTRIKPIIIRICRILQLMVRTEESVGAALVPYFRQLLPILNIFVPKNANRGDAMEFDSAYNLSDIIHDTLQCFERCAGEMAYINIKYVVPTYQSCTGMSRYSQ